MTTIPSTENFSPQIMHTHNNPIPAKSKIKNLTNFFRTFGRLPYLQKAHIFVPAEAMEKKLKLLYQSADKTFKRKRKIMTTPSHLLRNRMRSYDRQIGQGQRLARIKKYISPLLEDKKNNKESEQTKRDKLVEQVSQEIIDNLIGSGSTTPIVLEIKEELEREFPEKLFFSYGIEDNELSITRVQGNTNTHLSQEERDKVMARVRDITREKVSNTMICP